MSDVVAGLVLVGVPCLGVWLVTYASWTPIALRRRWDAADRREPPADLTDRPYDVAYLHGGPHLAVYAALVALHRQEALTGVGRGTVVAVGGGDLEADELERAVHRAVTEPTRARALARSTVVATALSRIDTRLVDDGLLLPVERRRRIRTCGVPASAGAVLAVPIVVAAVVPGGGWYGVFEGGMVALFAAGMWMSPARGARADSGTDALRQLAREHPDRAPAERSDAPVHSPGGSTLAIGLHGMAALRAADPEFAARITARRIAPVLWPAWWFEAS